MTSEVWKPIAGYEGLYEASNLGRIRSVDRRRVFSRKDGEVRTAFIKGRVLIPGFDGRRCYLHVGLHKDGKYITKNVHRIIASTFLPNPLNLPEVNHKDENKTNNAVDNLEWCDHLYNNRYGKKLTASRGEKNSQSKFNEETIREVRRVFIPRDPVYGLTPLAKKYGISVTHLCAILKRRRWGWLD